MIRRLLLATLIPIISLYCFGQVNVLLPATIPEALRVNAHSIKREERFDFRVRSIHDATLNVHQVFCILDLNGRRDLNFVMPSNKFTKLDEVEIRVYNSVGVLQKKYKKKDLEVEATSEGLVEDYKYYFLRLSSPSFPITVVYDYDIQYDGTLNYPDYEIQEPGQAVEYSSYTATVPADLDLRYKAKNIQLTPSVTQSSSDRIYKWEVHNLIAQESEDGSVSYESRYPKILISPNKFDMDGNGGELTTWKSFGAWYQNLGRDMRSLPPERIVYLQNLVKNAPSEKEKIRLVYQYLQGNFRYVLISLGIGGYKPFAASFVDQKKYGDCKALSNYTQACLTAVGIKSYQALVNAEYNREPVDPNFPHNSFNHVILCAPLNKDTVWLECTSNTEDFGMLGNFTENRNALLITDEGGVLVSTPKSSFTENTFAVSTSVKLTDDGSGETNSSLNSTGEYRQELLNNFRDEKKDDQKTFLVNHIGFPQPDEFELKTNASSHETILKLILEKVPAFSTGSKMFLNPRIYKIWNYSLPNDEHRKTAYYFECPFQKTDTTVYHLPDGYSIESLPKAKSLKFEYGSFTTNYYYDDQKRTITTNATLTLTQYKIPPEKFHEARKFFNEVLDEYTDKIIVKKNS